MRLVRRRLGADLVEQVVLEYKTGSSIQQLATAHDVSHEAMWSLLREEGVAMRYQSLNAQQIAQVVEEYQSGKSIYGVADKLGISKSTVARTLKKAGVEVRARGRGRSMK